MPIRKHGRNWEVRVQHLGGRISRSFSSFRDAQEFERRHKQRVADHRVGRAAQHSLEEAVERWLDGEAKALRSHRALENHCRMIVKEIEGKALTEVAEVAEAVIKTGREAGWKPATINRRLAILRRVARLAYRRWDWLEHDLAGRIQLLPGEETRYVQATKEQADKLLKAAKGRTRDGIYWALMTGLRKGELQAVKPYDFREGALVITKSKTNKPRIVPLAFGLSAETFPYDLTDAELERDFREARRRAGMPWIQFRDLRRTFGSWIVQKTRSLKLAQDLLGHTTPTITSRHYAHMLEGDLRKAIETLPDLAGMARGRRKKRKVA